jgi:hypothetical protein
MERIINTNLRKWLGVPSTFISRVLCSRTSKMQTPITSIMEEYKVGKARLIITFQDSLLKKESPVRWYGEKMAEIKSIRESSKTQGHCGQVVDTVWE